MFFSKTVMEGLLRKYLKSSYFIHNSNSRLIKMKLEAESFHLVNLLGNLACAPPPLLSTCTLTTSFQSTLEYYFHPILIRKSVPLTKNILCRILPVLKL